MRWIVGSLVLVNVIVLIWQLLQPEPASNPAPTRAARAELQGAPSLQLLSELDPATLQEMKRGKPVANKGAELKEPPLCTMVGPFPRLLRAEYLVERLQALDVASAIRELEVPGEPGYWVYLPAESSSRDATARLRELQAKGIDSYLIPKGELANGISLGMFSRQQLATQRVKAMRDLGYPAEISEITRYQQETWVVLPPGEANKVAPATWQEMLAEEAGLERRQNFCLPVASPNNIN